MVRGLVRQQEDATRVLGERLRNEAREHVSCSEIFFVKDDRNLYPKIFSQKNLQVYPM